MAIDLFELPSHPRRTAVANDGKYVVGGAFFLDYSKPLTVYKKWRIYKWWFGPIVGWGVPVVHENGLGGGFIVAVTDDDACFTAILPLWSRNWGEKPPPPSPDADGLKVIGDFARTFPDLVK